MGEDQGCSLYRSPAQAAEAHEAGQACTLDPSHASCYCSSPASYPTTLELLNVPGPNDVEEALDCPPCHLTAQAAAPPMASKEWLLVRGSSTASASFSSLERWESRILQIPPKKTSLKINEKSIKARVAVTNPQK